jgi:hypothetical protein
MLLLSQRMVSLIDKKVIQPSQVWFVDPKGGFYGFTAEQFSNLFLYFSSSLVPDFTMLFNFSLQMVIHLNFFLFLLELVLFLLIFM